MKKSTKGALAAAAAGALLLGGAGSLAYWTDTGIVAGGDIKSGHLEITDPDCGAGWTYDTGEDVSGAPFTPGTSLLVPGDVISQTCTTTLTATGEHMRGTITASTPTSIAPFLLDVGTITDATTPLTGNTFTEANSGDSLSVTITVTLPSSETANMDVTKALDAITLTAAQVHN